MAKRKYRQIFFVGIYAFFEIEKFKKRAKHANYGKIGADGICPT